MQGLVNVEPNIFLIRLTVDILYEERVPENLRDPQEA